MDILLIAPVHGDLPDVAVEVGTIASQHTTEVLQGEEARDAVINRVLRGRLFDVIWFATHGSEEGLLMSDGWLPMDGVAQYVRGSGAALCVINTCESAEIAEMAVDESSADAVYTRSKVPDRAAMRTGLRLSDALLHAGSFHAAYMHAKPGGGRYYRYLVNPKKMYHNGNRASNRDPYKELEERVSTIERMVLRLNTVVSGDDELGLSGLKTEVGEIKKILEEMRGGDTPAFLRKYSGWIVGAFFLLLLAGLISQYMG